MFKDTVYFRRCHMCDGLSFSKNDEGMIERCQHCKKAFARFQYFDDRLAPTQSDAHLRPIFASNEYEPIKGLTVHWNYSQTDIDPIRGDCISDYET